MASPATPGPSLLSQFPPSGTFPPSSPPVRAPLASYWSAHFSSPLTREGSGGPVPTQADVVVIGSGLTATCFVDRLVDDLRADGGPHSNEPVKVVVLEAREFCSGATARNGGHLTAAPLLAYATLSTRFGTEEARRSVALEQYSIDWVVETCTSEGWVDDVELRIGGGNVHLFDTPQEAVAARSEVSAAERAGEDVSGLTWLTRAQVFEKYGADSNAGGLLIPGNNVYPLKLVTKLFERAQRRASEPGSRVSVELFTNAVVSSVEPAPNRDGEDRQWNVNTPRGTVSTAHVVHCTNGYLSSVLPSFATGPARIFPTRGQVVSIVPSTASSADERFRDPETSRSTNRTSRDRAWPTWTNAFSSASPFDVYMFQRTPPGSSGQGREIILGGCRDAAGAADWFEFGQANDSTGSVNERVGTKLREYLGWQFEGLESEESVWTRATSENGSGRHGPYKAWTVDREWTGIMGFREGGVPLVGPVYIEGELQPGQWVSAGYSGHGMPRAPASAHLVASLVADSLRQSSSLARSAPSPLRWPQSLCLERRLGFRHDGPYQQSHEVRTTARSNSFDLPDHFPRHYLTTATGVPDVEARLPGEVGFDAGEDGWVWV
ncbi:hypothetical protein JCM10212_000062 [Sporobolomyces blumeae]